jgi:hypothetical protein
LNYILVNFTVDTTTGSTDLTNNALTGAAA